MFNTNIENKELTISQLPLEENDFYEFKSSLIEQNKLKDALQKAASGFANSGGGYFIVGIDDKTGLVDGGVKKAIGKRPILDWVDNIINQVEPVPKYSSRIIDDIESKGTLNADCAVLSVYIFSSNEGPHMAPDCHYYIRAGKHTVPARHFLVEAIRSRRFDDKPKLTYALKLKQSYEHILQLGIISLSRSPAINVSISLDPLPKLLQKRVDDFPIIIPFIDQNNPFYFDVSMYFDANESFGKDINLKVKYSDIQNYKYEENFVVGLESTPPIVIGNIDKKYLEILKEIEKSINKISKAIEGNH